jgi:hypothetical protein
VLLGLLRTSGFEGAIMLHALQPGTGLHLYVASPRQVIFEAAIRKDYLILKAAPGLLD